MGGGISSESTSTLEADNIYFGIDPEGNLQEAVILTKVSLTNCLSDTSAGTYLLADKVDPYFRVQVQNEGTEWDDKVKSYLSVDNRDEVELLEAKSRRKTSSVKNNDTNPIWSGSDLKDCSVLSFQADCSKEETPPTGVVLSNPILHFRFYDSDTIGTDDYLFSAKVNILQSVKNFFEDPCGDQRHTIALKFYDKKGNLIDTDSKDKVPMTGEVEYVVSSVQDTRCSSKGGNKKLVAYNPNHQPRDACRKLNLDELMISCELANWAYYTGYHYYAPKKLWAKAWGHSECDPGVESLESCKLDFMQFVEGDVKAAFKFENDKIMFDNLVCGIRRPFPGTFSHAYKCADGHTQYGGFGQNLEALYNLKLQTVMEDLDTDMQGFIAYDEEKQEIVVAYRGTESLTDMMHNLEFDLVDWEKSPQCEEKFIGQPRVMEGTYRQFKSSRRFLELAIEPLMKSGKVKSFLILGHSLGGALSICGATYIVERWLSSDATSDVFIKLHTFGCPRLGNDDFDQWFRKRVIHRKRSQMWRLVNDRDFIPHTPSRKLGQIRQGDGYRHNNELVFIKGCENDTAFDNFKDQFKDHKIPAYHEMLQRYSSKHDDEEKNDIASSFASPLLFQKLSSSESITSVTQKTPALPPRFGELTRKRNQTNPYNTANSNSIYSNRRSDNNNDRSIIDEGKTNSGSKDDPIVIIPERPDRYDAKDYADKILRKQQQQTNDIRSIASSILLLPRQPTRKQSRRLREPDFSLPNDEDRQQKGKDSKKSNYTKYGFKPLTSQIDSLSNLFSSSLSFDIGGTKTTSTNKAEAQHSNHHSTHHSTSYQTRRKTPLFTGSSSSSSSSSSTATNTSYDSTTISLQDKIALEHKKQASLREARNVVRTKYNQLHLKSDSKHIDDDVSLVGRPRTTLKDHSSTFDSLSNSQNTVTTNTNTMDDLQAQLQALAMRKKERLVREKEWHRQVEEEKKKEKEERERAKQKDGIRWRMPRFKPLTHEEETRLNVAMRKGSTGSTMPLVQLHGCKGTQTCKYNSLSKLAPGVWLNDEIVNYWCCLCFVRNLERHGGDKEKQTVWMHTSFFFPKLFEDGSYNYKKVRKWTMRKNKFDIFSSAMERLLIPVNVGNSHWTLLCCHMKKKEIWYIDSMGGSGTRWRTAIFRYLQDEHMDKKGAPLPDIDDWKSYSLGSRGSPQQRNGYDCGVFTCMGFDYLEAGRPLLDGWFKQANIDLCRERIGIAIMNNKAPLQYENKK
eukprot:g3234.t1